MHSADTDIGPLPDGVSVSHELDYYDVNAATLSDVRQAIAQSGPRINGRTWGAVTTWHFRWTYQSERMGATACQVRRAQVQVALTTTFPRWQPTAEPDSVLAEWWQQYAAGLAEHERGHAMLAARGAGEIVRALVGVLAFCDNLRDQTNVIAGRLVASINAEEEEYDRATRHGGVQIQQARRLREP